MKAYHRAKITVFFLDLGLYAALLFVLQFGGFSARLAATAQGAGESVIAQRAAYGFLFFTIFFLAALPLRFYSGFVLEHDFKLATQTLAGWFRDQAKKFLLGALFFLLTLEFFYAFLDIFPDNWWMTCSVGWLFLMLFLSRILPTVLMPMFYKTRLLEREDLKSRLLALCARCGVRVLGIYEIAFSKKTRKANAAVVGIGRTRRVVLGDTLIENFTPEEIEMVMAHELGHHVKRHILRSTVFNFMSTTLGFYLLYLLGDGLVAAFGAASLRDLTLFPVIAFLGWAGGLLWMPLQNGFSRWQERQADRYALETIPSKDIFCSLMNKLMIQNLANPAPARWVEFLFYDHPSIPNRIRFAQSL